MRRRSGDYDLTAKQAAALAYADAGLTGYAIAKQLGVSVSVITKRLRRARQLRDTARNGPEALIIAGQGTTR